MVWEVSASIMGDKWYCYEPGEDHVYPSLGDGFLPNAPTAQLMCDLFNAEQDLLGETHGQETGHQNQP
jgi:hypothetical protein